jgi:hypothetical protein
MAADILDKLSGVTVWRALEVMREAIKTGLLGGDPRDIFKSYEVSLKEKIKK